MEIDILDLCYFFKKKILLFEREKAEEEGQEREKQTPPKEGARHGAHPRTLGSWSEPKA